MAELLLEIGTEEIPSDYLEDGLNALKLLAGSYLKENRIGMAEEFDICGTPRRLVLMGKAIADKQKDVVQGVAGPPKKMAYDEQGKPTKAALGFAEKQGVSVDELEILETPKGEYVYARRNIPGRLTVDVLADILPKLIADIPWPKSMRWGRLGFSFVRPIHWVLALFDGKVVHFQVAGVRSGNQSRGHRFMKPESVEIKGLEDYLQKMKEGAVFVHQKERKMEVERVVLEAAREISGIPLIDPELLSRVTNMVEFPSAVCGSFDGIFLKLPDPVLITPMKEHQRYFAIRDQEGRLMPHFVAVNNTLARDSSVVLKGHERVLRARLSDADFFFKEDRKRPLESRLEDLKEVIYQAELGTSHAKVQRFTKLAEFLSRLVVPEKVDVVRRAARLSKCDLVTEMVMEFPSLQGIMGREYARLDGHPEEVCLAIHEHYLPTRAGGELPTSPIGAIVGMADRMDTIAGCFAIGLEPTGTTDPFALRRHALATIRILEHMGWDISLRRFISTSLSILREEIEFDEDSVFQKIAEFFRERYKNRMLGLGFESDLIEAVISVGFDRVDRLGLRISLLKRFIEESEEFKALVLTFKRVTNILKKQDVPTTVNPELFKEPCESRLWEVYQKVKGDLYQFMEEGDYLKALNRMMDLKEPVDAFFDGVEILTKENPPLRDNRVGILQNVANLLLSLADFSKFSI